MRLTFRPKIEEYLYEQPNFWGLFRTSLCLGGHLPSAIALFGSVMRGWLQHWQDRRHGRKRAKEISDIVSWDKFDCKIGSISMVCLL